ncbi:MAG: hypothetical protein NTX45_23635 [Proteobacteria bacterium]|nr:hypothetical protein [Pseudomonadota bacterium]
MPIPSSLMIFQVQHLIQANGQLIVMGRVMDWYQLPEGLQTLDVALLLPHALILKESTHFLAKKSLSSPNLRVLEGREIPILR